MRYSAKCYIRIGLREAAYDGKVPGTAGVAASCELRVSPRMHRPKDDATPRCIFRVLHAPLSFETTKARRPTSTAKYDINKRLTWHRNLDGGLVGC